jgi:hypothetical protein
MKRRNRVAASTTNDAKGAQATVGRAAVREFRYAAEYVVDHPLALWNPGLDEIARALVRVVATIKQRRREAKKPSRSIWLPR